MHTIKDFGIVNKAEIDVVCFFFLELSCFFDDLVDVGNLISGSSAFSKTSLNIALIKLSADGLGCTPSLLVVWPEATQPWGVGALW